jgi:hypothetical protein
MQRSFPSWSFNLKHNILLQEIAPFREMKSTQDQSIKLQRKFEVRHTVIKVPNAVNQQERIVCERSDAISEAKQLTLLKTKLCIIICPQLFYKIAAFRHIPSHHLEV